MEGLFTRDIKEQEVQTYQQTQGQKECIDREQRQEVKGDDNLDRQQQQTNKGRELANLLGQQKKIAKSNIACNIGKKALEYFPDIYENLSGKIKNKQLKKIFDWDDAKKLVRYGSSQTK